MKPASIPSCAESLPGLGVWAGVMALLVLALSVTAQTSPLVAPFTRVTHGAVGSAAAMSVAAAWGDCDNDGFPDVVVTKGTIFNSARSALYRNDGNGKAWIKVR